MSRLLFTTEILSRRIGINTCVGARLAGAPGSSSATVARVSGNCDNGVVPNEEMATYWNDEGGRQWVRERIDTTRCSPRVVAEFWRLRRLNLGERVLDVGCGNGATTLDAARRVGAGGRAVGIDLSGLMLEEARRRTREEGLDVEFFKPTRRRRTFRAVCLSNQPIRRHVL